MQGEAREQGTVSLATMEDAKASPSAASPGINQASAKRFIYYSGGRGQPGQVLMGLATPKWPLAKLRLQVIAGPLTQFHMAGVKGIP